MSMQNKVYIGLILLAALAVLFPPWGYQGHSFDTFAFIFSNEVVLRYGSHIGARIAWHILGIEIGVIALAALANRILLKDQ